LLEMRKIHEAGHAAPDIPSLLAREVNREKQSPSANRIRVFAKRAGHGKD